MKFEDYLEEKTDVRWLADNVIDKKYKGMEITNAVFDDKEDKMVKFWVRDPKTKKLKEIRPIPRDELVKVLKEQSFAGIKAMKMRHRREREKEATMGPIGGNWKKVASLFQNIFSQLTMLEKLGVYKDKKYGKRLKKIDTALEDIAEELDDEFGG